MKRLNETALKSLIRKLHQTGVDREPRMRRGRICARVAVGDIVTSKMFATGYRQGDATVVGSAPPSAEVKVVFNPVRARVNYVVENVRDELGGESCQLVQARRLAKDGGYDPRGEIILFRQYARNSTQRATAVLVVGKLPPAVAERTA